MDAAVPPPPNRSVIFRQVTQRVRRTRCSFESGIISWWKQRYRLTIYMLNGEKPAFYAASPNNQTYSLLVSVGKRTGRFFFGQCSQHKRKNENIWHWVFSPKRPNQMILDMSPHSPTNPKAHVQGFQPAFHCFKYEQSTKVPGYLKTASGMEGRDLKKRKTETCRKQTVWKRWKQKKRSCH